ncbi:MAG TPA: ABC transporter ATP-binding protein [Thermohalobaculum sp.]|nr:ABC transporter ATP-binding protein [Thermohalobaculum sp.]
MAGHALIEATGLSKVYGTGPGAFTALRDASLAVTPGELVAVMGPSGSGKSSLMNLIGLLDRPTGGRLRIMGEEVTVASADRQAWLRNRHIGFVFQAYHLMPRRTALGNVELPLIYRGLPRRERLRRAEAALDRVGLTHRAAALPPAMSGGEQQRVAIARALVTDPQIIVADEPTGALDSRSGELVLDLLGACCGEGRAVVVVTHDAAVAVRGTRLVLISDGRILRDGPLPVPQCEAA